MFLWNYQKMHRRSGIDIMKSYQIVIVVNQFRWNLPGDDLAENTVIQI
jgi:hypothetical protein